ncbi:uncharacterized protein N7496_000158, partial [Penicillium cataractarum]
DLLVVLAWTIILTAAIIWQIEGRVLYELYSISADLEVFTPAFLQRYNTFMRFLAPLEIFFYSGLWCIKFSFLAFFYRLSCKIKPLRIWWYMVMVITAGVYIASVADIEYKCSFGGIGYIIEQCSQLDHIHYENRSFWANCAGDVVTDMMILSIPVLVLWNTRISRRKKVILLSIFSATILIMVIAIVRVAVDNTLNSEINIAWLCFWSFVELFITAQNRSSKGKGSYQNMSGPTSKSPKNVSCQTQSRCVGDVGPHMNDDVPLSPLNIVYVHRGFEVTSAVMSNSGND